jgi:hypothetical protein
MPLQAQSLTRSNPEGTLKSSRVMDAYIDDATVWTNDPPDNRRIFKPLLGPWVNPQLKQWTTYANTK